MAEDNEEKQISVRKDAEEALRQTKDYAEHIFRVVPSAIFTVDKNRRVTSWNKKAEEITDFTAGEMIGKECTIFAEAPCNDRCGLYADNVKKPVIAKECAIRTKAGQLRIILKNVDLLKDNEGNIIGGVESFEDITERKKAEEKILQAGKEWQNTFDSISDIIFILDKDNAIRRVNKVFLDAFKVKMEDVVGKKCYELIHKSDKPWAACPHVRTLQDAKPHTEEVDDPVLGIPLLVSTSPIFNEKGECIGTVHIAKNISEMKKAQTELKRKMHDLEVFHKAAVGRELKMEELKKKVKELEEKLSEKG